MFHISATPNTMSNLCYMYIVKITVTVILSTKMYECTGISYIPFKNAHKWKILSFRVVKTRKAKVRLTHIYTYPNKDFLIFSFFGTDDKISIFSDGHATPLKRPIFLKTVVSNREKRSKQKNCLKKPPPFFFIQLI